MGGWREVGDRVYVRRHRELDLNTGLVVGATGCLVVDTRSTAAQARELIAAIRTVTPLPWTVVNTHAHYDHCFGNATFRPATILGHAGCAAHLREYGERQRASRRAELDERDDAAGSTAVAEVVLDPPDVTFTDRIEVDLGGRTVTVRYLGRGHTDHDVVVDVPEAGVGGAVVFAGDLVEEGAPPSFEDSFPLDWPFTVGALLPLANGPVVPGHGDVVDRSYVERQAGQLARLAERARMAHRGGRSVDATLAAFGDELPFPEAAARVALGRAFWQLDPPSAR